MIADSKQNPKKGPQNKIKLSNMFHPTSPVPFPYSIPHENNTSRNIRFSQKIRLPKLSNRRAKNPNGGKKSSPHAEIQIRGTSDLVETTAGRPRNHQPISPDMSQCHEDFHDAHDHFGVQVSMHQQDSPAEKDGGQRDPYPQIGPTDIQTIEILSILDEIIVDEVIDRAQEGDGRCDGYQEPISFHLNVRIENNVLKGVISPRSLPPDFVVRDAAGEIRPGREVDVGLRFAHAEFGCGRMKTHDGQ